jgi:hypothetical protein
MLTQRVGLMVTGIDHVVNAVTEIAGAIKHRNAKLLQLTDLSVIITKCFHWIKIPF